MDFVWKLFIFHNVCGTLLESLKIYEKEQAEGLNRNDEILYIRQFLEELKTDMEEKNRYLEEVPQRMAEM